MMLFTEARQHGCRVTCARIRGHDNVIIENEVLSVRILASKGADVAELRHKASDVNLLWQGRRELLPQGAYVETVSRTQGSFLDHFHGGWQELFPNGGFACTYEGAQLGQHGEVSVLPWHVQIVRDEVECVVVRFWVDTIRMPFRIAKTVTLESQSAQVTIDWQISNLSPRQLHYSWGQHPGFGPPLLTDDCVIDLPGGDIRTPDEPQFPGHRLAPAQCSSWPNGRLVDGSQCRLDRVEPSSTRTHDVIYVENLPAGWAAIRNPVLELGLAMQWDQARFPYLWLWQVYGGMADYPSWGTLYHIAIEPFTGPFGSLVESIAAGLAPSLAGDASVSTSMTVTALAGAAAAIPFQPRDAV